MFVYVNDLDEVLLFLGLPVCCWLITLATCILSLR